MCDRRLNMEVRARESWEHGRKHARQRGVPERIQHCGNEGQAVRQSEAHDAVRGKGLSGRRIDPDQRRRVRRARDRNRPGVAESSPDHGHRRPCSRAGRRLRRRGRREDHEDERKEWRVESRHGSSMLQIAFPAEEDRIVTCFARDSREIAPSTPSPRCRHSGVTSLSKAQEASLGRPVGDFENMFLSPEGSLTLYELSVGRDANRTDGAGGTLDDADVRAGSHQGEGPRRVDRAVPDLQAEERRPPSPRSPAAAPGRRSAC